MNELLNGVTLYHGSYCEVKQPSLAKCAKRKDFGRGFYLTSSREQADEFCIKQLLPNKLKDQYCFKTERALECLKFVKGEKIWLGK